MFVCAEPEAHGRARNRTKYSVMRVILKRAPSAQVVYNFLCIYMYKYMYSTHVYTHSTHLPVCDVVVVVVGQNPRLLMFGLFWGVWGSEMRCALCVGLRVAVSCVCLPVPLGTTQNRSLSQFMSLITRDVCVAALVCVRASGQIPSHSLYRVNINTHTHRTGATIFAHPGYV